MRGLFSGFIASHPHPATLAAMLAGCGLLCPGVRAQGPSAGNPNTPPQQPQADSAEVVLDLVARDKRNRPIVNLNPSDIVVTDEGTPVHISGLHLVTANSGVAVRIAMLLDALSPESAKTARVFAEKLLAAAPAQSSFAVLGIDRGLRLLADYTTDRAAARAALEMVPDGIPHTSLADAEKEMISIAQNGKRPTGAHASVDERANATMMLAALEDSQKTAQERQAPATLAGLLALARAQQGMTGRKIIVFFSEGIRTGSRTEELSQDVVEAASRAGVSIYTVDTQGVATTAIDALTLMYQPGRLLAPRQTPGTSGMLQPSLEGNITAVAGVQSNAHGVNHVQDDMDKAKGNSLAFLANGTGGFAMSTGDNLRKPLEDLVRDIGSYYEASYTPALKNIDGQFHPLDIHALRTGITVRSRSGYFALPPDETGTGPVRPSEAPLIKLLSGAPPNEIAFKQAVLNLGGGSTGRAIRELAVEIPIAHLELRRDQQTLLYAARASVMAEVKDKSGVVVERFHEEIARNGALEAVDAARAAVVTLQRHFAIPPGDYGLESVVLDRISGKAGAQRTEFTVPVTASGPWLSDVVLVRRTQPINGVTDAQEPLAYKNARVIPNLAHEVPAGNRQISFLVRVQSQPGAGDALLSLDVERDGKAISHSASKIAASPGSASTLDLASVDAANLGAGAYRAVFTLIQGGKSVTGDVDFMVDGNPGEAAKPGEEEADATDDTSDVPQDAGMGRFTPTVDAHAPVAAVQSALLDGARERAEGYLRSLVNFKCLEITDRYVDHKGNGKASHDNIAELLTYENQEESRQLLQVNGRSAHSVDMAGGRLEGAFGGALKIVFAPASNARFVWKQKGTLDGAAVEVFDYTVDAQHSQFSVTSLPASSVLVAFHGQVFIDAATRGVRRITIVADDIPAHSPIHASSLSIDYDYVTMNDHDYLVPVRGEMQMQLRKTEKILHRIEFRDYHRFGSQTRIVSVN